MSRSNSTSGINSTNNTNTPAPIRTNSRNNNININTNNSNNNNNTNPINSDVSVLLQAAHSLTRNIINGVGAGNAAGTDTDADTDIDIDTISNNNNNRLPYQSIPVRLNSNLSIANNNNNQSRSISATASAAASAVTNSGSGYIAPAMNRRSRNRNNNNNNTISSTPIVPFSTLPVFADDDTSSSDSEYYGASPKLTVIHSTDAIARRTRAKNDMSEINIDELERYLIDPDNPDIDIQDIEFSADESINGSVTLEPVNNSNNNNNNTGLLTNSLDFDPDNNDNAETLYNQFIASVQANQQQQQQQLQQQEQQHLQSQADALLLSQQSTAAINNTNNNRSLRSIVSGRTDSDSDAEYSPDRLSDSGSDSEEYREDRTVYVSQREVRELKRDNQKAELAAAKSAMKPMSTRRNAAAAAVSGTVPANNNNNNNNSAANTLVNTYNTGNQQPTTVTNAAALPSIPVGTTFPTFSINLAQSVSLPLPTSQFTVNQLIQLQSQLSNHTQLLIQSYTISDNIQLLQQQNESIESIQYNKQLIIELLDQLVLTRDSAQSAIQHQLTDSIGNNSNNNTNSGLSISALVLSNSVLRYPLLDFWTEYRINPITNIDINNDPNQLNPAILNPIQSARTASELIESTINQSLVSPARYQLSISPQLSSNELTQSEIANESLLYGPDSHRKRRIPNKPKEGQSIPIIDKWIELDQQYQLNSIIPRIPLLFNSSLRPNIIIRRSSQRPVWSLNESLLLELGLQRYGHRIGINGERLLPDWDSIIQKYLPARKVKELKLKFKNIRHRTAANIPITATTDKPVSNFNSITSLQLKKGKGANKYLTPDEYQLIESGLIEFNSSLTIWRDIQQKYFPHSNRLELRRAYYRQKEDKIRSAAELLKSASTINIKKKQTITALAAININIPVKLQNSIINRRRNRHSNNNNNINNQSQSQSGNRKRIKAVHLPQPQQQLNNTPPAAVSTATDPIVPFLVSSDPAAFVKSAVAAANRSLNQNNTVSASLTTLQSQIHQSQLQFQPDFDELDVQDSSGSGSGSVSGSTVASASINSNVDDDEDSLSNSYADSYSYNSDSDSYDSNSASDSDSNSNSNSDSDTEYQPKRRSAPVKTINNKVNRPNLRPTIGSRVALATVATAVPISAVTVPIPATTATTAYSSSDNSLWTANSDRLLLSTARQYGELIDNWPSTVFNQWPNTNINQIRIRVNYLIQQITQFTNQKSA